jgi:hypothetical protein
LLASSTIVSPNKKQPVNARLTPRPNKDANEIHDCQVSGYFQSRAIFCRQSITRKSLGWADAPAA